MAKTQIPAGYIAANAITATEIATNSITAAAIASDAIVVADIADNSITSAKIAADAVGSSEIAANAVNSAEIVSGSIDTVHIADSQVTNAKLANSSVTVNSNSVSLGSSVTLDTDDIGEGSTNLYYTDARVGTYISGNRSFGNITTTGYIAGPATFTIDPAAVGDNTGTVVIAGNLQVDGTTTTINSTTMTVDDLNIVLASGAANAAAANGAGITVDTANASITYDGTNDEWDLNKPLTVSFAGDKGITAASSNSHASIYVDSAASSSQYIRMTENGTNNYWIQGDSSGKLNFRPAGSSTESTKVVFDSSGNVGIGTYSPAYKLQVAGDVQIGESSGGEKLFFRGGSTKYNFMVGKQINVDNGFEITPSTAVDGMTFSTPAFVVKSSGNVGIGSTNPAELLTLRDADPTLLIQGNQLSGVHYSEIEFKNQPGSVLGTIGLSYYGGASEFYRNVPTNWSHVWKVNSSEKMRIDSSGNVGIGITSFNEGKLHIKSDGAGEVELLTLENSTGTNGITTLTFKTTSTDATKSAQIFAERINASGHTDLAFRTYNGSTTEHMRIDADGKVGIGTSSPAGNLHIKSIGDVGDATLIIEADNDNNVEGDNPRMELRQDGNLIAGYIYLEGNVGSTANNTLANSMVLDGKGTGISFATGGSAPAQAGGATNSTVRMTVAASGNVGIANTSPSYTLDVTGTINASTDVKINGASAATTGKAIAMALVFG